MSDADLRELERRWRQTGLADDERTYRLALRRSRPDVTGPPPLAEALAGASGDLLDGLADGSPRAQVAALLTIATGLYVPTHFLPQEQAAVEGALLTVDRWVRGVASAEEVAAAEVELAAAAAAETSRLLTLRAACRVVAGGGALDEPLHLEALSYELRARLLVQGAAEQERDAARSVLATACASILKQGARDAVSGVLAALCGAALLVGMAGLGVWVLLGEIDDGTVTPGGWVLGITTVAFPSLLLLTLGVSAALVRRDEAPARRERRRLHERLRAVASADERRF